MLSASSVMGVRSAEDSIAMLWPWLARMSQSEGVIEVGSGAGERRGLSFRAKRCLLLSLTAVRMSSKVTLRDLRRFHWSWGGGSADVCGFPESNL